QIAAHLLDTATRRLSLVRDGEMPAATSAPADIRSLVDAMNERGVDVYGRLSPRVLIRMMRVAVQDLREHLVSLDPKAPAAFAVSWAGEQTSSNWFDTARELTERWHHQEQIRVAVKRPGIMTPRLYAPVLQTFMRALPYGFRHVEAAEGTLVQIVVSG